jgi:hypothetical protein
VEGPVVEVIGVDEGLVDREAFFGEVGVAGIGKTILEIKRDLGNLVP